MDIRKPISFTLSALLLLGGLTACSTNAGAPAPDPSPAVSDTVPDPVSPAPEHDVPSVLVTPDVTPSPLPEVSATPGVLSPVPTQQPNPDDPRTAMLTAYAAGLERLYYDHVYPNGDELTLDSSDPADLALNRFAIFDVDRDGEDELLFLLSNTITAGMLLTVYRYDPDLPGSLMVELVEFPDVTFYDNGVARADMSHNHSRSMDLWPYFLYSYDPISDTYEYVASAEAWDKAVSPDGFPDEIDQDGDGVVYAYYIGPDEQLIDGPAYQEWLDSWMGDGQPLDIPYQAFTEDNIRAIS